MPSVCWHAGWTLSASLEKRSDRRIKMRSNHVKRMMVLVLSFTFVFLLNSGGNVFSAETQRVKVGISAMTTAFLPLFVAKDKGFFKEEGLDVSLIFFKTGRESQQSIVSKDIDIAAGATTEPVYLKDADQDVRIIWGISDKMPYKLFALPSIKTLKDAKGKRFAVSGFGALTDFLTRYVLKHFGMDPETDVKILQVGSIPARYAALKSGAVDVAILDEPLITKAEKEGYSMILDLKDVLPEWQYEVFYVRQEDIPKHSEMLKKFLRAYQKGTVFTKKSKEESIKINMAALGFNREDAEIGYNFFVTSFRDDGTLATKGIEIMVESDFKAKNIKKQHSLNELVDNTFIDFFKKK
jgi:NitT/TauT family transport system substrate-binding protein